jgi:transketolase
MVPRLVSFSKERRDDRMTTQSGDIDNLCINTIRILSIDAVEKAASGHPGMPMGAAPMAYVLWTRFFQHNPANSPKHGGE